MKNKLQYDKINKAYLKLIETPLRKYVYEPTFNKLLLIAKNKFGANFNGKILDAATGEGRYARKMKKFGASEVLGVDISKKMINLANSRTDENGVEFKVGDLTSEEKWGEFDVVTAVFLLHYSKSKKELLNMCKTIYKNLKNGGVFICINSNPFSPQERDNKKFGEIREVIGKKKDEGSKVKVTLLNGKAKISFIRYFLKPSTYNWAFKTAGFRIIKWYSPIISEEGIKKYGNGFWRDYKKDSNILGLTCVK